MIAGIEIENGSCDDVTLTMPLLRVVYHQKIGINIVYLCAEFDNSSFTRSRDIIGGPKI